MPVMEDMDRGNVNGSQFTSSGLAQGFSSQEVATVDIDEIANVLNVKVASITRGFFKALPGNRRQSVFRDSIDTDDDFEIISGGEIPPPAPQRVRESNGLLSSTPTERDPLSSGTIPQGYSGRYGSESVEIIRRPPSPDLTLSLPGSDEDERLAALGSGSQGASGFTSASGVLRGSSYAKAEKVESEKQRRRNGSNEPRPTGSPCTSIDSGPDLMFPGEDDQGGWVPIPDENHSFNSDGDYPCTPGNGSLGRATPAPSIIGGMGANTFLGGLIDKEAKLPPGNALGNLAGTINTWLQNAIPKLPTTTTMSIVQDGRGAHYGNIQNKGPVTTRRSANSLAPSTNNRASILTLPLSAKPLKKKLNLPRLPSEVSSVRLYRHPGDTNIYLTVLLNRPLLAWIALFVAYICQGTESFIFIRELRRADEWNSTESVDNIFHNGVSVVDFWVMELLFLMMLPVCLVAWILGDFDDRRGGAYALSGHGAMHIISLVVFYGLYTVPWSKHTEQSGKIVLLYIIPPLLIALLRFVMVQSLSLGVLVGLALMEGGFAVGITLPDAMHDNQDEVFSYLSVVLSSLGLAGCLYFAKQVRPHFPLPLLLSVVAFGGALGHLYFALESDLSTEKTLFGFISEGVYFKAALGLTALRGVAAFGWLWALMYLSPLTVAAPMMAQRLLGLVILSIYEDDPNEASITAKVFAMILSVAGVAALCAVDIRDCERKVCLNANDTGGIGSSITNGASSKVRIASTRSRERGATRGTTQSCASLRSMKENDDLPEPSSEGESAL